MIQELITCLQRSLSLTEARRLISGIGRERHIWLIGNGGSAAVASHIANDLVGMGMGATALTDGPTLSAAANDHGWEESYARQVKALMRYDDLLIAISSSGKSRNIIQAVEEANELGFTITLSGFDADNPLRQMGDVNLWIDSQNYGVVEVAHLALLHEIVKP